MQVTLGGDRIGSGNKMKVRMRNFERSSHDISTVTRTSMAAGVITPVFCDIATIGTTYEFNGIRALVRTEPTVGPLYGTFEMRVEVFIHPVRLTQGMLHNNPVKLGLNAQNVLLPQIVVPLASKGDYVNYKNNGGNLSEQFASIGPSCLINYLGAQTLPLSTTENDTMEVSAGPALAYYDYVKDYHLNKQEDNAYVIGINAIRNGVAKLEYITNSGAAASNQFSINQNNRENPQTPVIAISQGTLILQSYGKLNPYRTFVTLQKQVGTGTGSVRLVDLLADGSTYTITDNVRTEIGDLITYSIPLTVGAFAKVEQLLGSGYVLENIKISNVYIGEWDWNNPGVTIFTYGLALNSFPIENLDKARETILSNSRLGNKVTINKSSTPAADNVINWLPYSINCEINPDTGLPRNADTMNGLMVGCYKSDLFNNWLNTEWIDGTNGINELSAIPVENNQIMIEDLIVQKKVYTMLNRIAIADGTYRGYQEAVWGEDALRNVESPVYCGGMACEIVFDEVVSTSETQVDGKTQPIGTLAGRGRATGTRGGRIKVRIDEASWVMAVCTITPRIDYDAACKFYMTELKSFYDLHKPSLDQIGFQNLPVSQMAGWNGVPNASAGKQPSWIQYQTGYNTVHGDFADDSKKGYMTLKRAYEMEAANNGNFQVKDLTTYIDPAKFNRAFAITTLEAQNFEVQLAFDVIARRKMSANQIPNL